MSGPRPVHLERRGAVYTVRFRVPAALSKRLGTREIRRSLFTKDIDLARQRCLDATLWFNELMKRFGTMTEITKDDLELAARSYFDGMASELDRHRPEGIDHLTIDSWVFENVQGAADGIKQLENELRLNVFDRYTEAYAQGILQVMRKNGRVSDEHTELLARQLINRAHRQIVRFWKHRLENPALPFIVDDPVFDVDQHGTLQTRLAERAAQSADVAPTRHAEQPARPPDQGDNHYPALSQLVEMFVDHLREKGAGASHRNEIARALAWLEEELGHATPVNKITTTDIRAFRNNVIRLDATGRGKSLPFRERLTDIREQQITHATASKYWGAVKSMFAWALSEGICADDPTAKLRLERPIGVEASSPEAYSTEELIRFYRTPLYTGYKSESRTRQEGDCHRRGQHWWAGVLPLFTGMRAGELSQLLPSDFFFDEPIPYLQITQFDQHGERTKRTKTPSSVRRVPIAPPLLDLGLRQFVERRKKVEPRARVFQRFRMGTETDGKLSEGMVRFWGDYVRHYGLHKKGRGTHVWRHTVVDFLTRLGAIEEDIAGFVGHERGSQTSRYGRQKKEGMPLERLKPLADRLEFGFDLVSMLGGPYRDDIHRA